MPVAAREGAKPKMSQILWDCVLERLKESAIVDRVVDFCAQYKPSGIVGQKDRGNEADLELAIRKRGLIRGVAIPFIRWVPTNSGDRAPLQKARRIKQLELPLSQDQLWFANGPYDIDVIFAQFLKVGGGAWVNSNSHRHDDCPDVCSLAYTNFFPRTLVEPEDPKTAQERKDQQEEEYESGRRQQMHSRMFGNEALPRVQTRTQWEAMQRGQPQFPTEPTPAPTTAHPRHFPRGGGFAVLPPPMTRRRP